MRSMEILIIDIETTDFLIHGGLIVEIGIVKLDLETGNIEKTYHALVREKTYNEHHKDSWIFNNSDLKHEKIIAAEPLDTKKIQDILNKYPATAYNKQFDFNFLRSRGLKINELPCPMELATDICKIENEYGYKWPSVQEAWNILINEPYIEKHRGLDDAFHEARIVHKLYEMGVFKVGSDNPQT